MGDCAAAWTDWAIPICGRVCPEVAGQASATTGLHSDITTASLQMPRIAIVGFADPHPTKGRAGLTPATANLLI